MQTPAIHTQRLVLPMAMPFALALAAMTMPASAQSLMPGAAPAGRYSMQPVEGGIARLDTVTGEVSLCTVAGGAMSCEPSREDRERLEARIRELSAARPDGAPDEPNIPDAATADAAPVRPEAGDDAATAEFDRALGQMKEVFRAFRDIAKEFDETPPGNGGSLPNRT